MNKVLLAAKVLSQNYEVHEKKKLSFWIAYEWNGFLIDVSFVSKHNPACSIEVSVDGERIQ